MGRVKGALRSKNFSKITPKTNLKLNGVNLKRSRPLQEKKKPGHKKGRTYGGFSRARDQIRLEKGKLVIPIFAYPKTIKGKRKNIAKKPLGRSIDEVGALRDKSERHLERVIRSSPALGRPSKPEPRFLYVLFQSII